MLVLEDLVDDAVVTASCRAESLEFTDQWFSKPSGVVGDGPEDSRQGSIPNLVGELVEMAQTLRRDFDLVHGAVSDVVAETKSLAFGGFLS